MTSKDSLNSATNAPAPGDLRRLLVITYHFPPDGAVGGLRWSGLAKYLARLGWEVHIITAAEEGADEAPEGVHRHVRVRRRILNDVYRDAVARMRHSPGDRLPPSPSGTVTSARHAKPPQPGVLARMLGHARIAGGMMLDFPDEGRGWVLRAGLAARRLLRTQSFDAVITSGPPHSAHFAGIFATIGNGGRVPHIIDMRDPWHILSPEWPGYVLKSRLFAALESIMFLHTRNVVVNTVEFAELLQAERPRVSVTHISNGTDTEALPRCGDDLFDDVSIAYAGTLYIGRSFGAVLAGLESLARECPDDAKRVRLRIAGQMPAQLAAQWREELSRRGLEAHVEILGSLPRAQALDMLRRSRLALVLAQAQPTQVPAKLYECVGLGVPTLVIAEASSAASREGRRIGALTLEPNDIHGMRCLLEDLVHGRVPTAVAPRVPISYEALARQMDGLILRTMANGGAPALLRESSCA